MPRMHLKTMVSTAAWFAIFMCMVLAAALLIMRVTGYELLSVQSDSMQPVMRRGDAVLLHQRDTDPVVGDVVSFPSAAEPRVVITHRVVGVDNKRGVIATKGDNTPLADPPVPAWNIMGRVTRVVPGLGYVLDLLKHPLGLLAIMYVPALGIIISEIQRLSAYYTTGRRDNKLVHYRLHYKLR